MANAYNRVKELKSISTNYDDSVRSAYQQCSNMFVSVMSEMVVMNVDEKDRISSIVDGFIKNHNNFYQSQKSIDLGIIEGQMATLGASLNIGQLDSLFYRGKREFVLKSELLSIVERLNISAGELRREIDSYEKAKSIIEVPNEIAAPIRVQIANERIVLINRQTHVGTIDYPAANRVRESLRETFAGLLEDLPSSSNVDGRFIKASSRLLNYLMTPLEDVSIEAFGLNYQLVSRLTSRLAEEAGGTIIDEIQHTLAGIGVLLNQFEEWQDYLRALAFTQIDQLDGDALVDQAVVLAEQIETRRVPVDPNIAARLREMVEPVINGLISSDTIAAPLIGSLSNYFAIISTYVLENAPNISHIGAAATVGGSMMLLTYSIDTLKKFCPILCQYHPLKFILDVLTWFTSRYSQTKDVLLSGRPNS